MGGDITGKMLVPIVEGTGGRYRSHLFGRDREVGAEELPALRKLIADAGFYAYDTTPDQIAEFRDHPELVQETFRKHMHETLSAWMSLAEERLAGTGIMCLLAPGNDDPLFVDDVLGASDMLINPEGQLVELPGGFTMISVGYSNPTPWDSPGNCRRTSWPSASTARPSRSPTRRRPSSTFTCRPRTPRSTRPWPWTRSSARC